MRATLAGLQCKLAKPKSRKEPVTPAMLVALVDSLGPTPSLADVCLVASSLLAFSAFLRYDELAKLRCCNIQFAAISSLQLKACQSTSPPARLISIVKGLQCLWPGPALRLALLR